MRIWDCGKRRRTIAVCGVCGAAARAGCVRKCALTPSRSSSTEPLVPLGIVVIGLGTFCSPEKKQLLNAYDLPRTMNQEKFYVVSQMTRDSLIACRLCVRLFLEITAEIA